MASLKKFSYFFFYLLFRFFSGLISLMPHRLLYHFGQGVGVMAYYLHREFRKKTLSNLAIAFPHLSEHERVQIAKKSFQNLLVTTLEFAWIKSNRKKLLNLVHLDGGNEILELMRKGQGIIFMTAHQANWEIPFLTITEKFPGIGVGRPIKNPWIYRYVVKLREINGGRIVLPKKAIQAGVKSLSSGHFAGIVADQAFPESSYSYPLFGTRAWTTTMPALLALRTNCPIVVATVKRNKEEYHLSASTPLWPNQKAPVKEEIVRLMDLSMGFLEESIRQKPEDWLWQHDRFKQQGIDTVKRKYRFGFVLIILPKDPTLFIPLLPTLRDIYHRSFLSFLVPSGCDISVKDAEILFYREEEDMLRRNWRYQFLIDFSNSKRVKKHYSKLGVRETVTFEEMKKNAPEETDLNQVVRKMLCKN